jgi:exosortase D (VPLPA-CTERM-specific)
MLIWLPLILAVVLVAGLIAVFWDGLALMVTWWEADEYNHGYLIPPVALYLLWLRGEELRNAELRGSWTGLLFVAAGLCGLVLGELSAIYTIIQYAFMLTLLGIIVATIGWPGFRIAWVPYVYLIFMIPLPNFLYFNLSAELQLISSQIGVAVIRLFGISVFLEGNVIDLGIYQLQVAEACSGLRYLFPLMSFGFLCAAIYRGPWWHRAIIFLSAIPLTILMNSFRIGVIGVLVENFGIEQAEGFLHYFEGWIVFMACVGIMFLIMWVLSRLSRQTFFESFGLDVPPTDHLSYLLPRGINKQFVASLAALGIGLALSIGLQSREELVPEREQLSTFPLSFEDWQGRDRFVDQIYLDELQTDDYLLATYRNQTDNMPVELWIAYYDTQRKGRSVHSPKGCLPGGGWRVESLDQHAVPDVGPAGNAITVNRSLIVKGDARQLVYYWFVQRGRIQTNEYLVKWFIFWDALTRNRTDGALVRVTTFVPDVSMIDAADRRLQAFVRTIDPKLAYYLPQHDATFKQAQAAL